MTSSNRPPSTCTAATACACAPTSSAIPTHRRSVLLHGGGQTRFAWGTTAPVLAERGWRVYRVDLRGHGESDWPGDGDYGLDAFAGDVPPSPPSLPEPPVLVGASLGGIASILAIGRSETPIARGLVLVDVAPKIEQDGAERIGAFMSEHLESGFGSLEEVADAVAAYNPHRPRPTDLSGLKKNVRQRADGRWVWHWDPRFMSGKPASRTRRARVPGARGEPQRRGAQHHGADAPRPGPGERPAQRGGRRGPARARAPRRVRRRRGRRAHGGRRQATTSSTTPSSASSTACAELEDACQLKTNLSIDCASSTGVSPWRLWPASSKCSTCASGQPPQQLDLVVVVDDRLLAACRARAGAAPGCGRRRPTGTRSSGGRPSAASRRAVPSARTHGTAGSATPSCRPRAARRCAGCRAAATTRCGSGCTRSCARAGRRSCRSSRAR